MNAAKAMRLAAASGIRIGVEGSHLILDADLEPPVDVVDAIRTHKAEIIELLGVSGDEWTPWSRAPTAAGGDAAATAPTELVQGVARLIGMDPPAGYTTELWRLLVRDAEHFIDTWAGQAAALGWSDLEVFGCHRRSPAARLDAMGLVAALNGDRIVAMTDDDAVIENARGTRARHFRQLTAPEGEWAVLWDLM